MRELAHHYQQIRSLHPEDKLLILFDIDGTILDMRYMILFVLQSFDRSHGTTFFRHLRVSEIDAHENHVEAMLRRMGLPEVQEREILDWYLSHRWSSMAMRESHRPFAGIMEVIRWFQLQPNVFVGLNTGRPEQLRHDTLLSLNRLGEEYKVSFSDSLLRMNPYGWDQEVGRSKAEAVTLFRQEGYRVFAMVDNEPANLRAVSKVNSAGEMLLLHANTIFESRRVKLPQKAVRGRKYDLSELIDEDTMPQHVEVVWHGVNDEANLRQFLVSDVHWGELDVRLDPASGELVLRHDSFDKTPAQEDETLLFLEQSLKRLQRQGKGAKLDLKEREIIEEVLKIVSAVGFRDSDLWFNGNIENLRASGFQALAARHPQAVVQCPIDFLAPLIIGAPDKAREIVLMLREWGINRFSVSWATPDKRKVFDLLEEWGGQVNVYNVPDLEAFLQAVLLLPKSVTSDFNIPRWHYYGRGSGEDLRRYEYSLRKAPRG